MLHKSDSELLALRPLRRVQVVLPASELAVFHGQAQVARREWLPAKSQSQLNLDHYLEILVRKPGALPLATVLEQARAAGSSSWVTTPVGRGMHS